MIILTIDTSCDDTCIAILKIKNQKSKIGDARFDVLSNIVSSQVEVHQKYGGVYPFLAKREHQKNLVPVLKKALRQGLRVSLSRTPHGKQKFEKPNLIAVTVGPGLEPCLWVGVNFAKALAYSWNLPIIPVNHIEAHILANFLNTKYKILNPVRGQRSLAEAQRKQTSNGVNTKYLLPAICLVVSGGHTQLILIKNIGIYKIIGETRDDAAGECFDKTARILGLGYPGGPSIAQQAAQLKLKMKNEKLKISLPRPMINSKDYDFSFSGLKTAVLYDFKKRPASVKTTAGKPRKEYIREMAKEIQQAIIDVLIKKTIKAAKDYRAKSIILGGGVAANKELRKQFNYKLRTINYKLNFLVPPRKFCTDNAVMIGIAGYFNRGKASKNWKKIKVDANLRI